MESEACIKAEIELRSAKKWKVEKKEIKENLKTLSEYEAEARKVFQEWIRLRDKNLPCISCDNSNTTAWDAGHYFKAELYSGLIFTEENVHKQCKQCNHRLHGNESGYRIGLVSRYGEDYVKELEAKRNNSRVYNYSKTELIEIKENYKLKIKELR